MPQADREPGWATRPFVALIRHPIGAFARWMWDLHVTGREHLPQGPHVIAANHLSFLDPVIVTLVERQNVRYLAVAELFDTHHLFDRLITFFGAIPTPRDRVPIAAVRTALAELDAGRPVGLFPEGRRVAHWRQEGPQRGAAWLALHAGVPLVPAAVVGSDGALSLRVKTFTRTSIRVWVEPPIDPHSFVDHEDPVGAIGSAWLEALGKRLDPWWGDPVAAPEDRATHRGESWSE